MYVAKQSRQLFLETSLYKLTRRPAIPAEDEGFWSEWGSRRSWLENISPSGHHDLATACSHPAEVKRWARLGQRLASESRRASKL